MFVDQYGWGHTGSVDGAVSCAWMLDDDRTVVVATVAGSDPSTGGGVCNRVDPAFAAGLGIPAAGTPPAEAQPGETPEEQPAAES